MGREVNFGGLGDGWDCEEKEWGLGGGLYLYLFECFGGEGGEWVVG